MSSAEFPPLFDEMVAFPSLDDLTIQYLGEHTTCIWGSSVSSTSFCKLNRLSIYTCNKLESVIPVSMLNRLHNLEYLNIEDCSRLRNAFPPCIARDLIRLEYMWIHYCGMMTEIIGGGDQQKEKEISDNEDHDIIMFPNLTDLNLVDLQNLTGFRAYQNWESNTCKVHLFFSRLHLYER
ncbi:hypothetical protein POM88_020613 [Heracleum sosnowskyi]|uniref:Disease resistance protein At4g27190-like leucine-rich repeats domain-containing protein n=1 Tax=Heracleum sosnowskyi TaxID=360622 RepID=A0AAD8MT20_9APIA|nr:hypothetical protein POM88_020613 [Heracleum sosnowskyi]